MQPGWRAGRNRRGVTLVELLISASVLSLILGAVLVLQLQGLRMYQDVAASDFAAFDATMAVERIEKDVQGCYRVIGRYADRITLSMPKIMWDFTEEAFVLVQPIQDSDAVRYYLSDESGELGNDGTHLWRSVRRDGTEVFVRDARPLTDKITSLCFTYTMAPAPRDASVQTCHLLVAGRFREGGTTRTRIHSSEATLRNVGFGPVTEESGIDPFE